MGAVGESLALFVRFQLHHAGGFDLSELPSLVSLTLDSVTFESTRPVLESAKSMVRMRSAEDLAHRPESPLGSAAESYVSSAEDPLSAQTVSFSDTTTVVFTRPLLILGTRPVVRRPC